MKNINEIKEFSFSMEAINEINDLEYSMNWPVVYILSNDKQAYIGETTNVLNRTKQHLKKSTRRDLKKINIIYDNEFNKSAILDIESLLINYMLADNKYKLQNRNSGISPSVEYYQRSYYQKKFENIWDSLRKKNLVVQDLLTLRNSDMFKYSPYKSLTKDQYIAVYDILLDLLYFKQLNQPATFIVSGGAGTGKSVLATYIVKLLTDIHNTNFEVDDFDMEDTYSMIRLLAKLQSLTADKIALVIPMTSLRSTLKKVFSRVDGLFAKMVISPNQVVHGNYDILIVDEAHRLRRNKNIMGTHSSYFKKNDEFLELENSDELDWIINCSKYQILFYDSQQSIKPSDVRQYKFEELKSRPNVVEKVLTTQLRVRGGNKYVKYVHDILTQQQNINKVSFQNYNFKLFNDINEMINAIKELDKEIGICRVVAGYSWKWVTKKVPYEDIIKNNLFDININGNTYIWNHADNDWIFSNNAINEIGCIHTVQGYDLNYTGVIFGNEIKYNEITQRIEIDQDNYYDINGKKAIENKEELHAYILNIYEVLLTRGIEGTFVYVCDDALRTYLSKYIEEYK